MRLCKCGNELTLMRRQCDECKDAAYQRKLLSMRAKPAHCVDCDAPVSRKGQRCQVHLKIHKRAYLQEYRRNGPPEKQRPLISDSGIYVTPAMQRVSPAPRNVRLLDAQFPWLRGAEHHA